MNLNKNLTRSFKFLIISTLVSVAGCVTTQYYHPKISNKAESDRARLIDLAECKQVSSAGFSNPSMVVVTEERTFSAGFASGQSIGEKISASIDRKEFTHACMLKRGWTESEQEAQDIRASMKEQSKNKAINEWEMTVKQFLISQSSMRGDADYINNPDRMETLDAYVKALASDDSNKDKPMIWFLEEADKLVKLKYGIK